MGSTKRLLASAEYERGDRIGNRYRVHSIAGGGMGVIYFCVDLELNLPFALKTPRNKRDERLENRQRLHDRFLREAETWASLGQHPNIVRCYSLDRIDNQPFLFLEWIAASDRRYTSLYHLLKEEPLSIETSLALALDICYGMRHAGIAHPGLVHRDLKPGNVLVDQEMTAKISDFGLARVWNDDERETTKVVGTAIYRPPEIWMRQDADVRSDIYATGLILFEMLSGVRFVDSLEIKDVERAHLVAPTPHLPESVPADLDEIVFRAIQKDPEARYQSFDDLIADLQAAYFTHVGQPARQAPQAGKDTSGDFVNRGNTFAQLERYRDSMREYNHALELDPRSAVALQNRGSLQMMMGRLEPALADLNASIQLNPRIHSAYYNRAVVLRESGQNLRALQDYNRAISLAPSNVSAYYNRAILLREAGQLEQALVDLSRVINLTPGAFDAWHNRGLTHLELQDYQSALKDFTRALELQPDQAASYYNRGVTNQLLGNVDEAIADYTDAIARKSDFRQAFEMRALLRHEKGEHKAALDDYTRAILLGPDERVDLYYNRALLLIEMGDNESAILNLDFALALDRHYLPAQLARAQAFLLNNQPEEAREIGEGLLLLNFDSVPFHQHLYELFKAIGDDELAAVAVEQGEALMAKRAESDLAAELAAAFAGDGVSAGSAKDRVDAFETFSHARTPEEVEALIERYPFMAESSFVAVAESILLTRELADPVVTPRKSTANKARILWLRHYAHL